MPTSAMPRVSQVETPHRSWERDQRHCMREHDSGLRWAKTQISGDLGTVPAAVSGPRWHWQCGWGRRHAELLRGTIYTRVCAVVLLGVVQGVA